MLSAPRASQHHAAEPRTESGTQRPSPPAPSTNALAPLRKRLPPALRQVMGVTRMEFEAAGLQLVVLVEQSASYRRTSSSAIRRSLVALLDLVPLQARRGVSRAYTIRRTYDTPHVSSYEPPPQSVVTPDGCRFPLLRRAHMAGAATHRQRRRAHRLLSLPLRRKRRAPRPLDLPPDCLPLVTRRRLAFTAARRESPVNEIAWDSRWPLALAAC